MNRLLRIPADSEYCQTKLYPKNLLTGNLTGERLIKYFIGYEEFKRFQFFGHHSWNAGRHLPSPAVSQILFFGLFFSYKEPARIAVKELREM